MYRHDAISNYVARSLEQLGYSVHKEPCFKSRNDAPLKPDLVAYAVDHVALIDTQVINDQFSLETAHTNKVAKYEVLLPQLESLRSRGVNITSCYNQMAWRGFLDIF